MCAESEPLSSHLRQSPNINEFLFVVFVVQLVSHAHVQLFVAPWTAACQTFLPFTISWSLLKFMSIDGEVNGTPLQSSCLENPMDGGAW